MCQALMAIVVTHLSLEISIFRWNEFKFSGDMRGARPLRNAQGGKRAFLRLCLARRPGKESVAQIHFLPSSSWSDFRK